MTRRQLSLFALALLLAFGSFNAAKPFRAAAQQATAAAPATQAKPQRPIELPDILAWKRISTTVVSNDGQFFAYKLTPAEGDGEVIVRRVKDGKDWRFPIGESAGLGGGGGAFFGGGPRELAFSDDAKWFAYTIYPTAKEAKQAKRTRRPLQNKVALVNLSTEKKVEFEKVRRFSFSNENAGWLALQKYGAEPAAGGPPAAAAPAAPGATPAAERATGSDLLLYELATGNQLNVGNVNEFAFDKKGNWLAWTIDATDKSGNGVQARNMTNGAVLPLDSDKASYRSLDWNDEGTGLTCVKGVEDKAFEDKLYSVVAFNFTSSAPQKTVYDPREDKTFPAGLTVSPNRTPAWTDDFSALTFGIHATKKKKPGAGPARPGAEAAPDAAAAPAMRPPADEPERPDLVLWHWRDGRLQAQQQVEESRDKNFSFLAIYHVADKKFVRLADETLRNVAVTPKQKFAIGYDNREYELTGSLDGRRYQDVYSVDLKTGARKPMLKKSRWAFAPSPDGTQFLYYDDGNFFNYDLATGQSVNLTAKAPVSFINTEDDHNVVKPPTQPVGWSADGKFVLLSDNWDIWQVPARGGQFVNLTGNGKKDKIRYRQRLRLDPDEKGIDLSAPMFINTLSETTKQGGIARIDAGKPGAQMLLSGDASFGSLLKAKKADAYFYTRENYQDYPNYYVASNSSLTGGQKLTDANPQQKDFTWSSGSKLIEYTSAKGDKLQGSLFLPANYEPGKSYPTIIYIYEKLTQGHNNYAQPSFNGFNKSVYTSNGYAVLMPDIVYKVNDPGMSAVWCILPALQAAIATGVVDKDRVALHGHSWGGYQTAFMVTQTDALRAAIAGAPLTDMISMYNLIYWNSGGGNMAIFESSQGRFTGSPVDIPEAYIRNSPVFHAKNVKTPLMILHNDKDGAVDFTQGIEYFNQLRRLQKPVVMLQYKGENHGLRVPANMKDYTIRMKEFFDYHLKGKPAPKWLTDGVPHLQIKEHLEERTREKADPVDPLNDEGQR